MTTLLVSEVFPPTVGGSSRWFWELYRRLPREQYLLAVGEHADQDELDRTHDLRLRRIPLPSSGSGVLSRAGFPRYIRSLRAVRQLARRESIRQLHCGRCLPEGWIGLLLKRLTGLPYLCYVHGEEVQLTMNGGRGGMMSSRELRWMTGVVLRGAESLIVNSRNSGRILREDWGVPADRVSLLYPGVDTKRFFPRARNPEARARLGWDDRTVLLTVGRLVSRKGHDQMIRALGVVRRDIPDVLYAIVGAGEEICRLKRLVAAEGVTEHVRFMGEVDEDSLLACYQQCDLFVLPNRQIGGDVEGFGIVLLEAQACGKPVLAGASGGTVETMRVPETGLIVECNDHLELAARVLELMRDEQRLETMGRSARQWAVERFDWAEIVPRAQEIFSASR